MPKRVPDRYRKISVRLWNDEKVRALTDDGQTLWVFILTHPDMTSIGAMRTTMHGLAAEKVSRDNPDGWPLERLMAAISPILESGMAEFDQAARCLAVPNFILHNLPTNPKIVKSWAKIVTEVPECGLRTIQLQRGREAIRDEIESIKVLEAFDEIFPEIGPLGTPPARFVEQVAPVKPPPRPVDATTPPPAPEPEPEDDLVEDAPESVPTDGMPSQPEKRVHFLLARNAIWSERIPKEKRPDLAAFILKKGAELGMDAEHVRDWMTRLHVWAEANPAKARKKDFKRFFGNNLSREAEKLASRRRPETRAYQGDISEYERLAPK